MRKVIVTFGLISGGITSLFMIISMTLWKSSQIDFDNSEIIGYGSMIVAFSMIFFGMKSFRDNQQRGAIKFGKGVQIGLLITLISSIFYVATWEVYFQADTTIKETFMDRYAEHALNKLKSKGASTEDLEKTEKQMNEMKEAYKNPFFRLAITFAEVLPMGILVTLLSAAILRKKEVLPA